MIPYVPQPEIVLGPLRLHAFGLLVGTGVCLGTLLCLRVAERAGLSREEIRTAALWALLPGFVFAATFRILVYAPQELAERGPLALVDFSRGMSSYGGFLGAVIGVAAFARLRGRSFLRFADVLVQGLALGWFFGRSGCTLAHDHIGTPSTFFLAFAYPGGPRHNLGLYEALFTLLVMLPLLAWLHRRVEYRPGLFVAAVSLTYGPARFLLDYLRPAETELRHGGFTVAQYLSVALTLAGVWALNRWRVSRPSSP